MIRRADVLHLASVCRCCHNARTGTWDRQTAISQTSVWVSSGYLQILLFCKGAESSVFPLCKNSALVEDISRDIDVFANKGLRTLAIAYRVIPDAEYNSVAECESYSYSKWAQNPLGVIASFRSEYLLFLSNFMRMIITKFYDDRDIKGIPSAEYLL